MRWASCWSTRTLPSLRWVRWCCASPGAEALYADLGHFGKRPIRLAWFVVVMPALLLNYFGQGAMLLQHPENARNPFYEMAPQWALFPLIGLATLAAVIASQALITAAFSVTKQAVQLGYLPRLRLLHTSVRDTGQIYVPFVNWALYGCVVFAVVMFGSSSALASAYGIAVTIDMTITTLMTFFVIRWAWKLPLWLCVAATGFFFVVDITFLAANAVKVLDGGWFPLLIGVAMFTLMVTWKRGRRLMADRLREESIALDIFMESIFISPPLRVPGTAVFLSAEPGATPFALLHNLKHNKVLHEQNLFVSVLHHEVPWIGFDKRCDVSALGHDCWQVTLHFGFKNDPDASGKVMCPAPNSAAETEANSTSVIMITAVALAGRRAAPYCSARLPPRKASARPAAPSSQPGPAPAAGHQALPASRPAPPTPPAPPRNMASARARLRCRAARGAASRCSARS
jgi:KUP system potassium uptake protein